MHKTDRQARREMRVQLLLSCLQSKRVDQTISSSRKEWGKANSLVSTCSAHVSAAERTPLGAAESDGGTGIFNDHERERDSYGADGLKYLFFIIYFSRPSNTRGESK